MRTLREKRMYIKEEKCKTCKFEKEEECTLKKNNVKYASENCTFNFGPTGSEVKYPYIRYMVRKKFVSTGDELKNRRNRIKNRTR